MDLLNEGYLPEAIINYLALLGWSPEDNEEIFTIDELIKKFNPKRINKSSGAYDVMKLRWVNAHYIKKLDDESLCELTIPYLKEAYDLNGKTDEWLKDLVLLYKDHISYGRQIVDEVALFFNEDLSPNDEAKEFMKSEGIDNTIRVFKEQIQEIDGSNWSVEAISNAINKTKEISGSKGKMLYMPIRIKVSGIMHGPELPNTIYLLGRDKVLERLSV